MDRFLPWIAVAAGVLALAAAMSKRSQTSDRTLAPVWASLVGIAAIYALAFAFRDSLRGLIEIAHGVALGAAATLLAAATESRTGRNALAALGIATATAGAVLLLPAEMRQSVWLGCGIGAGLAAACASLSRSSAGAERLTAFLICALTGACVLGTYREGVDRAAAVPIVFGVLGIAGLAAVRFGSMNKWVKWLIVAIVLIGGAKLVAMRYLFLGASFNVALGAVISAAVVAWILEDEKEGSHGSFAICTLIWLAWSTVAFGLLQGLGIAVSVVAAAAFLLAAGSHRGLLSMSALVPLLFYRIFLEMYPTETRQIDVGQQYAVMGIVAGIVLPVAASSWLATAGSRFAGIAKPATGLLAGVITIALLVAADFILGSRGTVGVLIGLALAPFVAGLSGGEKSGVLASVGALAATVVVTFRFVSPHLLLERADKMQILGWCVAIAVLLIAIAHWLTRETTGEPIHESAA